MSVTDDFTRLSGTYVTVLGFRASGGATARTVIDPATAEGIGVIADVTTTDSGAGRMQSTGQSAMHAASFQQLCVIT